MNEESKTISRFTLTHRLQALFILAVLVYSIVEVAYRFSLPTDGWLVTGGTLPGYTYTRNILGENVRLQEVDRVIAVNGVSADWEAISNSSAFKDAWQSGATLQYTVVRYGEEVVVPVTLTHWRLAPFLANRLLDPVILYGQVSALALLVIAATIFFRRPDNQAAFPFLFIITFFFGTSVSELLPFGFPVFSDPLASFFQDKVNIFLLAVAFPYALIRFALVFPRPKPIQQRYPWLASAWFLFSTILILLTVGSPISWFWFLISMFLALAILVHNAFTMRDPVSRAQVHWGVGGVLIGIGALAVAIAANTVGLVQMSDRAFDLIGAFSITVIGVMISVAITRYRLFDIDILIRRTLSYSILTGLLALVYFGAVIVLQETFGRITGETQSPLITVISTLAIAALAGPLRVRTQDFIDRRFFRQKYDAEQVLARFATAARDEVDLEALNAALLGAVAETMQPDRVSLLMKTRESGE